MSKILNIMLIMFTILTISGCAAKAKIVNGEIILTCLGSCEAKFENGAEIKKGIITIPSGIVRVNP